MASGSGDQDRSNGGRGRWGSEPLRQDYQQGRQQHQSWPRQQQLPDNQRSWNGQGNDRYRHPPHSSENPGPQHRSQQGRKQNESQSRRQQPGANTAIGNQRNSQNQRHQQKPREFRPPPPRPNAWGRSPPQQHQPAPSQDSAEQTQQHPPTKPPIPPETSAQTAMDTVPGPKGAWGNKFDNKKGRPASSPTKVLARGQKVAPVILKTGSTGPPAKKPKNKHAVNGIKNNKNNSNTASTKIHGKKPKLSSISMGDLVPNINKIIPKDKNKKGYNESSQQRQTRTARQANLIHTATNSSDFPALPTTSNWPSLEASKQPAKAMPPPASASKVSSHPTTSKQPKPNGNNSNNQPKKRKNQSQQTQDAKKGGSKAKNGSSSTNTNDNNMMMAKPDENHLAAQFLFPPGKSLGQNHLQAQFGVPGGADGSEHDLMLRMQGGQVIVKGRQRIKPRKKKFTALKRKILLERLRVWKESHPEEGDDKDGFQSGKSKEAVCSICVYGFASLEELEDADEYEELLDNLKDMAGKMGKVRHVFIPRSSIDEDNTGTREHPVFVHFQTAAEAMAARGVWDGLVIGGQPLQVQPLGGVVDEESEAAWQQACLEAERKDLDETKEDGDSTTCCILLKGVLTEDDLDDDECFAESIQDIKLLVEKLGVVEDIQAKKQEGSTDVVIVYRGDERVAQTAVKELQKLSLGGSQLSPAYLPSTRAESRTMKLVLENLLTEDDLEDEECLEESLNDVRSLLGKFGPVSSVDVTGKQVLVSFSGMATNALRGVASEINGTCLGGQTMKATVTFDTPATTNELSVLLRNLLTQDDLEDDECLEESLEDVRELARQYGNVQEIEVKKGDSAATSIVKVTYSSLSEAKAAVAKFEGMVVGGEAVSASSMNSANASSGTSETVASDNDDKAPAGGSGDPKPMFSGDKRIPERFAACKRVPKVPNKGTPRNYAILTNNDTVKPLLVEMLNELMRLQLRALHNDKNAKNAKARRRVVIGLREVARGIRANKAKMVIMANNLDEYGAIDDKLQEILDLAAEKEIPVLFEMSKRVLGKSLGKKIKVSVAAIQATDGAHQQFVKLAALAPYLEKPTAVE